ncbi:spindle and kinetochore-associated protein 1 [Eurytemora carolleeae]|uniref:spindle and kinetochore-associated protein 1 n=1 Tax=Eurytemora carolleeae TaxID=1294199 RepID=UPI000C76C014|nr:spindle and kinetochore-associated protein 1 [Eurytemora carolleeae]|eukprot:XP_023328204.1 spindle and kinetochore-associated protein 1-like [Eurytemora affinis]
METMRENIKSKRELISQMKKQLEATKRITQLLTQHGARIKTYENSNLPVNIRKQQITNQEREVSGTEEKPLTLNLNLVQHLTLTEFNSIPKYMKGRVQYETLGTAVEEINSALHFKYTFTARKFSSLKEICDKKRWKLYKSQESPATRGVHFITADELKDSPLLKSEVTRRNLFTIFRHFKKIREIRGPGSIVRFASA